MITLIAFIFVIFIIGYSLYFFYDIKRTNKYIPLRIIYRLLQEKLIFQKLKILILVILFISLLILSPFFAILVLGLLYTLYYFYIKQYQKYISLKDITSLYAHALEKFITIVYEVDINIDIKNLNNNTFIVNINTKNDLETLENILYQFSLDNTLYHIAYLSGLVEKYFKSLTWDEEEDGVLTSDILKKQNNIYDFIHQESKELYKIFDYFADDINQDKSIYVKLNNQEEFLFINQRVLKEYDSKIFENSNKMIRQITSKDEL